MVEVLSLLNPKGYVEIWDYLKGEFYSVGADVAEGLAHELLLWISW